MKKYIFLGIVMSFVVLVFASTMTVHTTTGNETFELTGIESITFEADGGIIAFVSNRDGNNEIYIMDEFGMNQENLTNNANSDFAPSISPDKSHIAFASDRNGTNEVFIMSIDGSNIIQLTNDITSGSINGTEWLNNNEIVFSAKNSGVYYLHKIDTNGNNLQVLTDSSLDSTNPDLNYNGTKIYLRRNTPYNANTSTIYSCDIDGSNMIELTSAAYEDPADILVNGVEKILCKQRSDNQIFIMNYDGSDMVNISNNTFSDSGAHSDYPNVLLFTSDSSGNNQVWKMNYDGTNRVQLTFDGINSNPYWRN